ncbi:hypothetical protein EV363DRAFT_220373 [Boletus edulis]|nr:hypothetical protein EV363DRAFT_220373 [Boletus edulis]
MVLFHSRFHFVLYSSRSCISPSSEYVVTCSPVINSLCAARCLTRSEVESRSVLGPVRCESLDTHPCLCLLPPLTQSAIRRRSRKKYNLITRRLRKIFGVIKGILAEGRSPKTYWGTAPTGRPHIGYYVPLTKIADFLRAGVEIKVHLDTTSIAKKNPRIPR